MSKEYALSELNRERVYPLKERARTGREKALYEKGKRDRGVERGHCTNMERGREGIVGMEGVYIFGGPFIKLSPTYVACYTKWNPFQRIIETTYFLALTFPTYRKRSLGCLCVRCNQFPFIPGRSPCRKIFCLQT